MSIKQKYVLTVWDPSTSVHDEGEALVTGEIELTIAQERALSDYLTDLASDDFIDDFSLEPTPKWDPIVIEYVTKTLAEGYTVEADTKALAEHTATLMGRFTA